MPYSVAHKQRSRERILDSASRLFSRRGYDAVSIDDLMQDAGLTRGAFYNHFTDKADVYAEAIVHAALRSPLAQLRPDGDTPSTSFLELLDGYLSLDHVDRAEPPCPLAFLVTDVGVREPRVRSTYTRVYKGMVRFLKGRLKQADAKPNGEAALAVTALMIGGVAIARALDSPATAERLLKSCRSAAKTILEESDLPRPRPLLGDRSEPNQDRRSSCVYPPDCSMKESGQ